MRDKFKEFYKPTQGELDGHWKDDYFSFDANILLNLYRYSEKTTQEVINTFKYLKENGRLWISYQTAYEYQKNRLSVIKSLNNSYDNVSASLDKKIKEIENELNQFKRHPYLKTEDIVEKFKHAFEGVNQELQQLKRSHPNLQDNDPVFNELTEIFQNCVGEPFIKQELEATYKEGKERYEKKIPPGYMDVEKEKNGEQSLYGDLIIWTELIKNTKSARRNLIFVTDDLKEDWWFVFNGKTIGARPELLREFREETAQEVLIYKPEQFLYYFKIKILDAINDDTLKEVEEVRMDDEQTFISLKELFDYINTPINKIPKHALLDNLYDDKIVAFKSTDFNTNILKDQLNAANSLTTSTQIKDIIEAINLTSNFQNRVQDLQLNFNLNSNFDQFRNNMLLIDPLKTTPKNENTKGNDGETDSKQQKNNDK